MRTDQMIEIRRYRDKLRKIADEYDKLYTQAAKSDTTDEFRCLVMGIGGLFDVAFRDARSIMLPVLAVRVEDTEEKTDGGES